VGSCFSFRSLEREDCIQLLYLEREGERLNRGKNVLHFMAIDDSKKEITHLSVEGGWYLKRGSIASLVRLCGGEKKKEISNPCISARWREENSFRQ